MMRAVIIWGALGLLLIVPLAIAASSQLLAWRQPVYIVAGFAGVIGLGLMLVQPLLAMAALPGLTGAQSRRVHLFSGAALSVMVAVHVGALWLTSPPDVVDVLLLRSPTPFSIWGLAAMWSVFAAAFLAIMYRKRRIAPRLWRPLHTALVIVAVAGTVVHALLIEGTMGQLSKALLCVATAVALALAVRQRRVWAMWRAK